METLEFLRAWRAQIDTPEKWTKGVPARKANGEACLSTHPEAVQWCLVGSLIAVRTWKGHSLHGEDEDARSLVSQCLGATTCDLAIWQDDSKRTHAEVMGAFDRAIELARMGL